MIATRDYRRGEVTVTMTLAEFRDTVEWLEGLDPGDGATREWRRARDRIDPPDVEVLSNEIDINALGRQAPGEGCGGTPPAGERPSPNLKP